MSDDIFVLEHAGYTYPDGQTGLENVGLRVARGERVVVLGANASGKSTLLQLLDGLVFCTTGQAAAFGRELTEAAVEGTNFGRFFREQVAFLFQNVDAQLFCSTVEEELAFGPRHLGLAEDDVRVRVEDMLSIFELEHLRARPPQSLSGGEKRRVGLAAVLAVGPSVVLLDEPTSGLDPRSRAFLVDVLLDLGEAQKTVIVATHDLELAREVSDRAMVLDEDHRIAADGAVEEIVVNMDLLTRVNLVHIHAHRHGGRLHAHPHLHSGPHRHEHG